MAKAVVTEEDAFLILRKASQNRNRKLRDLADELVLTGTRQVSSEPSGA